jgi:TolB-like protein/Flp pilus assembly protein TadD
MPAELSETNCVPPDYKVANTGIDETSIREALARLLSDPNFHASVRNRRFLRFAVEETLAGRGDRVKSYSIAVDVFGRGEDFDGSTDPIVRIEAARLRAALTAYYAGPGSGASIRISLPKGGYVPSFEDQSGDRATEPSDAPPSVPQAPQPAQPQHFPAIVKRWKGYTVISVLIALFAAAAYWLLQSPVASQEPLLIVDPVAVAPGDPVRTQMALGLSQSLVMALTRFQGLRVVYAPEEAQRTAIEDRLGEDGDRRSLYVLDSSLREDGGSIRFWWRLSDVRRGETVWSDAIDRSVTDGTMIPMEDEIAHDVATRIGEPTGLVTTRETHSGYGCVLRARAYYMAISEVLHRDIRACLEATVAADATYADAWSMLAYVYLDEDRNGFNRIGTAQESAMRALQAAERAVALAPESENALEALMDVNHRLGNFEAADRAGRRAIEINPNNPELLAELGIRIFARGRWDEGAEMVRRAAERSMVLPPLNRFTLVFDHYRKGQFDEALTEAKQIQLPQFYGTHMVQAAIYGKLGRQAEARAAVTRLLELRPNYAAEMRDDFRSRHYTDALIDMLADGLRQAGLAVQ